jgi:hypothetical protein
MRSTHGAQYIRATQMSLQVLMVAVSYTAPCTCQKLMNTEGR